MQEWFNIGRNTFFLHGSRSSLMGTNFQSVQFKSSKVSTTYHDGNTFQYEKMGVWKISKPPNLFFEMVVFQLLSN